MDSLANKTVTELPQLLQVVVSDWLDKHAGHEHIVAAISADSSITSMLPKVIACSAYAADVLERQPGALLDLVESGRLQRPMADGELQQWFSDD